MAARRKAAGSPSHQVIDVDSIPTPLPVVIDLTDDTPVVSHSDTLPVQFLGRRMPSSSGHQHRRLASAFYLDNQLNIVPLRRVVGSRSSTVQSIWNGINREFVNSTLRHRARQQQSSIVNFSRPQHAAHMFPSAFLHDSLTYEELLAMTETIGPASPKATGAHQSTIDALPVNTFSFFNSLGDQQPVCPICIEDFKKSVRCLQMPCKHLFHAKCLKRWLKTKDTCPVCRVSLS